MYRQNIDMDELRRRANANLVAIRNGEPTRRKEQALKRKALILEERKARAAERKATALKRKALMSEYRDIDKEWNRLMKRQATWTDEERGAIEELDSMRDKLSARLWPAR